jgi:hypothetical protein
MAAKIGILGESTAITDDTLTTIYTVPADKAARVRFQFLCEGGGGTYHYQVLIGSPGIERTFSKEMASGIDCWSGLRAETTPDPALSILGQTIGFQEASNTIRIELVNPSSEWVMTPMPADYFLSTGDTVRFRINGADAVDHLCQVVGVEDDV